MLERFVSVHQFVISPRMQSSCGDEFSFFDTHTTMDSFNQRLGSSSRTTVEGTSRTNHNRRFVLHSELTLACRQRGSLLLGREVHAHGDEISFNSLEQRSRAFTHGLLFDPKLVHLIGIVCAFVRYDPSSDNLLVSFRSLEGERLSASQKSLLHLSTAKRFLVDAILRLESSGSCQSLSTDFFRALSRSHSWPRGFPVRGHQHTTCEYWFGPNLAINVHRHYQDFQNSLTLQPFANVPRVQRVRKKTKHKRFKERSYRQEMGHSQIQYRLFDTIAAILRLKSSLSVVDNYTSPTLALTQDFLSFVVSLGRIWTDFHTETEFLRSGIDRAVKLIAANYGKSRYEAQSSFSSTLLPLALTALIFVPSHLLDSDPTLFTKKAISFYKNTSSWDASLDITAQVLSFIGWFFRTGQQCFEQRSLNPIFHTGETYLTWYDEAQRLLRVRYELGLGEVGFTEYYDLVNNHIIKGQAFIDNSSKNKGIGLSILLTTQQKLRDVLDDNQLLDKVRSLRTEPFFIGLTGPPKLGKSYITAMIHEFFMNLHPTLEYHEAQLFVKSFTDKFDSGLESHHSVFLFDDVGTVNSGVSGELALAPLISIMETANQATSASNQADLEKKGKVFPLPQLVMVTSNDPLYGAIGNLVTPHALWRRIRYSVTLKVKSEFATGSGHVAPAKIGEAHHIHTFSVAEFHLPDVSDKSGARGSFVDIPGLQDVDAKVFWTWLGERIRAHHQLREILQGKRRTRHEPCEECSMPKPACICYEQQMFGWISGIAARAVTATALYNQRLVEFARRKVFDLGQNFVSYGTNFVKDLIPIIKSFELSEFLKTLGAGLMLGALAYKSTPTVTQDHFRARTRGKIRLSDFHSEYAPQGGYDDWIDDIKKKDNCGENFYTVPRAALSVERKALALPYEVAIKRITNNLFRLQGPDGTWVFGLGLYDNVMVSVRHFTHHILSLTHPEISMTSVVNGANSKRYLISQSNCWHPSDKDLVFFKIPDANFKDLRWLCLKGPPPSGTSFGGALLRNNDNIAITVEDVIATRGNSDIVRPMLGYYAVTESGMCGLPIVGRTTKGAPVLLGIHAYGDTRGGLSHSLGELVTQSIIPTYISWVSKLLRKPLEFTGEVRDVFLGVDVPTFHPNVYGPHSAVTYNPELFSGCVRPLGEIRFPQKRTNTTYCEAPLWSRVRDVWTPSGKIPPCLRSQLVGDQWVCYETRGLVKFMENGSTFDYSRLQWAEDTAFNMLSACFGSNKGYILSEEDSLNGVDGAEFLYAFKRKTGSGLPTRGPKERFIEGDAEQGTLHFNRATRRAFVKLCRSYAKGVNPGVIFDATLKDEVKKPGKDVRVFLIVNFLHNFLTRSLLLPLFRELQKRFADTFVSIGVRADSEQWRLIGEIHKRFSLHIDFDFSGFDTSHNSAIKQRCFQLLIRLLDVYLHGDQKLGGLPWMQVYVGAVRLIMFMLVYSNTTLYEVVNGLPSGITETAWFNSLIQFMMILDAALTFHEETGNFPEFYLSIYGDDGILSTNTEGFDFFFLQRYFSDRNIRITPGTKEAIPRPHIPFDEISFLKRKFVWRDGRCYAPLELTSIVKQLEWWAPSPQETASSQTRMSVDNVGLYLAAHPSEEVDHLYECVASAFEERFPESAEAAPLHTMNYFRNKLDATLDVSEGYLQYGGNLTISLEEKVEEVVARCKAFARSMNKGP